MQRERRLDEAGDPGRCVQMADVGLDRADRAECRCPVAPPARNACVRPAISIGSPSGVPVPCASTYEIVSGSMPASAWAIEMTWRGRRRSAR